jgi:hypothetical protein
MSESEAIGDSQTVTSDELDRRLKEALAIVDEKFDVEAIAQLVEHLDADEKLKHSIENSLRNLWLGLEKQGLGIGSVQRELRDLIMDVELLKRAVSSWGQLGVLERQRIEKELVLDLFPARIVRPGTGVAVATSSCVDVDIDCQNRLHLCKAACCRIFNILLTAEEIDSNRYDWNPRLPYTLHKNRLGCVYLCSSNWSCSVHDGRPSSCKGFSCKNDQRIWLDYENRIINPNLVRELDKIDGGLTASQTEVSSSAPISAHQESSVNPPDFSELYRRPAPEPRKKFVPLEPEGTETMSFTSPEEASGLERESP